MLQIDDKTGAVTFGDRIIGEYDMDHDILTLNMGWCRLAGLGVVVEGDKDDRRRVLLDRSEGGRAPEVIRKPRKAKVEQGSDPDQMALDEATGERTKTSSGRQEDDPWGKEQEQERRQPVGMDF